jgi:hypothetical protein
MEDQSFASSHYKTIMGVPTNQKWKSPDINDTASSRNGDLTKLPKIRSLSKLLDDNKEVSFSLRPKNINLPNKIFGSKSGALNAP